MRSGSCGRTPPCSPRWYGPSLGDRGEHSPQPVLPPRRTGRPPFPRSHLQNTNHVSHKSWQARSFPHSVKDLENLCIFFVMFFAGGGGGGGGGGLSTLSLVGLLQSGYCSSSQLHMSEAKHTPAWVARSRSTRCILGYLAQGYRYLISALLPLLPVHIPSFEFSSVQFSFICLAPFPITLSLGVLQRQRPRAYTFVLNLSLQTELLHTTCTPFPTTFIDPL